jgi:OFA family oxalate/formate antiporter-like MFS transporter
MGAILISGAVLLEFPGNGLCTGPARNPGKSSAPAAGAADLNTPGMLRTKTFQLFFLWMILLSAAGLMIIGHIAPCILELGGSRSTAALAVGIVSVFNGIGRVGFGISYDRLSIQKTLWLVNGCLMLAGILLSFAVSSANMPLLFLGCAVMGISYGGSPVSASAVVSRLFGSANFSSNFSVASLNLMFAALIGPTLAASLQDRSGSYQTSFYVLVALGIVSLALCLILTRRIDRRLGAASFDRSADASVV